LEDVLRQGLARFNERIAARSSQEALEALETVAIRDTRRGDRKGIKGQKPLDFPRAAGILAESRAVVVGRQARPLAAALVRWLVTLSRETMAAAARRQSPSACELPGTGVR